MTAPPDVADPGPGAPRPGAPGALAGRRILLLIGGGIAAFKALELIRAIRRAGGAVSPVLTKAGSAFVTPLSVAALAKSPVHQHLFDLTAEADMGHIELSRAADLVVVCPATADLLAKMAAGLGDDLASTLLLATDKPVLAAPAMNVRMWTHAATVANVALLRQRGVAVLEPDEGEMACGEYGPGRLPEVERILTAIERHFQKGPLSGLHALVTAGPTWEPLDPVRYLGNRSSGKQGFAVAAALADRGARVTLVSGPVALPTPAGVTRIDVETARQMAAAVDRALPADVAIMVAAVADWEAERAPGKIKKEGGRPPVFSLRETPDILQGLAESPRRPRLLIGFAAETDDVLRHARAKLARKGCDLIVANDVAGDVMGGDRNRVHFVSPEGVESLPELAKKDVAARLAELVVGRLRG